MKLNDLLNILKSNNYKITEQRKAILQVLVTNNDNLISVENLLSKSKTIFDKMNISTIYRNMEILEKLNLVYKNITENGTTLYKLVCTGEHHHHIICKKCGKTEIIDYCPIKILQELSKAKNFNLTDHKLELYGYCMKCESSKK